MRERRLEWERFSELLGGIGLLNGSPPSESCKCRAYPVTDARLVLLQMRLRSYPARHTSGLPFDAHAIHLHLASRSHPNSVGIN